MNWKILDCDVGQNLSYVPRKKPWIGAAIGAVGSILGASLTNSANASMDEETRDWQEYMWKQNNAYNHPYQVRHRLEQAGINPALAFQNGNTGVASSQPSAIQHTPQDWSAVGSGLSQSAQYMLQASQVKANNDLLKSQTDAQQLQNTAFWTDRILQWNKMLSEKGLTDENRDWIKWQKEKDEYLLDATQKQMYATIEKTQSEAGLNNINAKLGLDKNSREWKLLEPTIKQLISSAHSSDASALLNRRNANIVPRLSASQIESISQAYVDEMLKNASAEEIAGFGFKGTTMQEIKMAVKNFIKSKMQ